MVILSVVIDDPATAPIGKNVLTLSNVEQPENFTCVAVSKLGNIETTTTVEVKGQPLLLPFYNLPFSSSLASETSEDSEGVPEQCDALLGEAADRGAYPPIPHQIPIEVGLSAVCAEHGNFIYQK